MSKRFVTRIELTTPTREKLSALVNANDMTQVAILSRLVGWFASQPETIKAIVLGRIPADIEQGAAELILSRLAKQTAKG